MGITHPGKEALARELKALEQKAGVVPRSPTKGRAAVIRRVEKRSGTELLDATVSDWVLSGAPAHEFEHLWAYVGVLNESAYANRPPEAAVADRKAWRALWSRAREATAVDGSDRRQVPNSRGDAAAEQPQCQTVLEARERPGWPVRDVRDPFALEVQRAIEVPGDDGTSPLPMLPVYVEREHDALLRESVLGARQGRSALVTLIGGSWDAFTGTSYGRILIAKVGAVVLLLVAAGYSRRWTGRLLVAETEVQSEVRVAEQVPVRVPVGGSAPGDGSSDDAPDDVRPDTSPSPSSSSPSYRRRLRRSVLAEVTVGVAVLVITTVLTTTLPGRSAAEAAEEAKDAPAPGVISASTTTVPFDVGTPGGHGKVQVTLEPGRVGENTVQAVVFGPDDGFAIVPELRLAFSLPSKDIGPLNAELTDWAVTGAPTPSTCRSPAPGR